TYAIRSCGSEMSTRPVVGFKRLAMMFSRVDLPQPDGPMSATISPRRTSSETSSSTGSSPWRANCLTTLRTSTRACISASPRVARQQPLERSEEAVLERDCQRDDAQAPREHGRRIEQLD